MNETVKIWLEKLGNPTVEEIKTEIEEVKGTISNEHLCELGYDGMELLNPHTENIIVLEKYLEVLENLLKEKGIKEMKTVKELTREELNELKSNYFYSHLDDDNSNQCDGYDAPWDIPDEIIFEHYEGITFVKEDFFCNLEDDEIVELFYAKIDSERNKFQESYKTMEYIQIYNDYYIIGFYEAIHEILTSDYVKDNYLEILEWLNTKENPLEYLYDKWMDMDGSFDFGWDENINWINILYRKEKEV